MQQNKAKHIRKKKKIANQTHTDGSFIQNLADVMSDSSQAESNPDPDVHP